MISVRIDDKLFRGTAFKNQIRWSFVDGKQLCESGCKIHDTDPVSAFYFSQTLLCGALSIPLMKGEQRTTLRWQYAGALQKILVESDVQGNIRGLMTQPNLMQVADHEDVVMGESGFLSSVVSSEKTGAVLNTTTTAATLMDIADDLAMMYCTSNQIETEIVTTIHFAADPIHPIATAVGMMIQPLPGFDLLVFEEIRKNLRTQEAKAILSDDSLEHLARIEKVFGFIATDAVIESVETMPIQYRCSCEKGRMIASVKTLSKGDLDHMFESQDELALTCQFCNQIYYVNRADLE